MDAASSAVLSLLPHVLTNDHPLAFDNGPGDDDDDDLN